MTLFSPTPAKDRQGYAAPDEIDAESPDELLTAAPPLIMVNQYDFHWEMGSGNITVRFQPSLQMPFRH